jgi:uncharacterized membrane protein
MYLFIVFSTAFFIIGNLIRNQKKYNLIVGYNALTKEQRKKVDMKGLSRMVGNLCFFLGIITLILSFYVSKITILVYIALVYSALFYLLYNRSKYDKRLKEGDKIKKPEIIILSISFVIVVIFILMT